MTTNSSDECWQSADRKRTCRSTSISHAPAFLTHSEQRNGEISGQVPSPNSVCHLESWSSMPAAQWSHCALSASSMTCAMSLSASPVWRAFYLLDCMPTLSRSPPTPVASSLLTVRSALMARVVPKSWRKSRTSCTTVYEVPNSRVQPLSSWRSRAPSCCNKQEHSQRDP